MRSNGNILHLVTKRNGIMKKLTEADLCAAFIASATKGKVWTAYPETAGFDILLSRVADNTQIGIQAKLRLNAKGLCQILPHDYTFGISGPDYRAVLVPSKAT